MFLCFSGVEHNVRELADVCVPALVLYSLDGARQEEVRHADLAVHGGLWEPSVSPSVYLEF